MPLFVETLQQIFRGIARQAPPLSGVVKQGAFLLLFIATLSALLGLSALLPAEPLRNGIVDAYRDGRFVDNYPGIKHFKPIDMYTECVGLGNALLVKPDIQSLLQMETYGQCTALSQAAEQGFTSSGSPYPRYVHGYVIVVKVLYSLFSFMTVRVICTLIGLSLLGILGVTLYKKIGLACALCAVGTLLLTRPHNAFFLPTHAVTFWIVIMGAIAVSRSKEYTPPPVLLFACIGAADSFFSYLTMGSLSLGLPAFCYALLAWKRGVKPEDVAAGIFWAGLAWSIGYLLPWLLKWGLVFSVFSGSQSIFGNTLDIYPAKGIAMILQAFCNDLAYTRWKIWVPLFVLLAVRAIHKRGSLPTGIWCVMLPGLIPLIWISLLPGQSGILHAAFVNIILWPLLAAICLLLTLTGYGCNVRKGRTGQDAAC